ncbi:MAG: hypothetical protein CR979_00070 [Propionibacterium sp.]|nr:MAG: hypothetical protein CR979_00070 [Propionibacterium sp.]
MKQSSAFDRAITELAEAVWRPEITVESIRPPQRIAPFSAAISGDVTDNDVELGSGRFILLHDPAGNESWEGTFRCVSFVQADVDIDMGTDPLVADVGWSWLIDALAEQNANYLRPAGTVTASYSRGFGAMAEQGSKAEIEIRASWTPQLTDQDSLHPHLFAWQHLLCMVSGLPPDGITTIHRNGRHQ